MHAGGGNQQTPTASVLVVLFFSSRCFDAILIPLRCESRSTKTTNNNTKGNNNNNNNNNNKQQQQQQQQRDCRREQQLRGLSDSTKERMLSAKERGWGHGDSHNADTGADGESFPERKPRESQQVEDRVHHPGHEGQHAAELHVDLDTRRRQLWG